MRFLHIADAATHAGLEGVVAGLAAGAGIAAGAFVVFGLPALLQKRRARSRLAGSPAPDDT